MVKVGTGEGSVSGKNSEKNENEADSASDEKSEDGENGNHSSLPDLDKMLLDLEGRVSYKVEEEIELIRDVLRSSAKQSQAMLTSLNKAETERNQLMEILSQSKGASNAAFRSLSDIPGDESESVDDELYASLSKNNKKLKERLYQLERENLYLKESLQGDSEEQDNRSDKDGGPSV